MSRIYTTKTGDTFITISRIQYGDDQYADRISSANPGVMVPLSAGLDIVIPPIQDAPENKPQSAPGTPSEVSIIIDGTRFRFWNEVRITRAVDNIDTVEFSAPSNLESKQFRNTFKPFSYPSVIINVNGLILFKGVMISVLPVIDTDSKTLQIACYSLPGVLNDCTIPSTSPVEYSGLTLKEIATELCKPFGINVLFHVEPGDKFKQEATTRTATVLSFLVRLAQERNIIISSTKNGELLFQRSVKPGKPIAKLKQGEPPVMSVTPLFNAQNYYSHITGVKSTVTGSKGSQFTVKNSRLKGVLRPLTFDVNHSEDGDIEQAVKSKMGRMFGNVVSYALTLPTWLDPMGNLWEANKTIILHAHDAMIYTDYEFIIRNVDLSRDSTGEVVILNLVLPGSFEGKQPDKLPWDE